ncbi:MAG: kynurenine 3-monooxygenase [Sphingobacteriales bacterium]|jgi:kynurenine 3-monooxygenase
MSKKVLVAGAGLVGSLLSIYLRKKGYDCTILERRPDMRLEKMSAGRSINLALSDRGLKALKGVGLAEDIKDICIPMPGRMIHFPDSTTAFQAYGLGKQAINSVSRGELNKRLMDHAEAAGAKIEFDTPIEDINPREASITSGSKTFNSDFIIGADGAFSAVRGVLQRTPMFNYSQSYLEHGYKELTIPATANGKWQIEKNALHIWPRKNFMLIALPNLDGSFTCTLFAPFKGEGGFENLNSDKDVQAYFKKHFPDALPIMPKLCEDFNNNPTSSLVTVKCEPWNYEDKVCLIGDASHAIVPFYGQGMNSGFEDCTIFNEMLNEYGEDTLALFENFSKTRKPDADAIAELAIQNFIEMRDKVGDPQFLYRKKIEKVITSKYPEKYTPAYSLVTFSHTPYSKALKLGDARNEILNKIAEIENVETKMDTPQVQSMLNELFALGN